MPAPFGPDRSSNAFRHTPPFCALASLLFSNDLEDVWESYFPAPRFPLGRPGSSEYAVKDEIQRLLQESARKRAHNRQAKIHRVRRAIQRTTARLKIRSRSGFQLLELHRATRDLQQASLFGLENICWSFLQDSVASSLPQYTLWVLAATDNITMARPGVIPV
ncbi:MAG: hypothetical protein DHS80DRAFT_32906 [Piptocephalis tieghemiana]|nr:MAG: hypothetical protein DHS80DRAFT_32906 [Piptocephalis tieghemiana]